MIRLFMFVFVLIPSISLAAYQNPVVQANERQRDGSARITFEFSGNAGEPTVRRDFQPNASTTVTSLRNWVDDTINELNLLHTARTLPSLQPGQTVPRLARVTPAIAAKQVWVEKLHRYLTYKDAGLTSTAVTNALNALKADLEATYQTGFLD